VIEAVEEEAAEWCEKQDDEDDDRGVINGRNDAKEAR
jgi:hypothetical protein